MDYCEEVLRKISYGLYIITTSDNGKLSGCTINSVIQVTNEPLRVLACINHKNYTNSAILNSKRFAVSIVSEKTNPIIIGTFGYYSSRDINKFEKINYEMIDGIPVIKDCLGYITCNVIEIIETDTHSVFLAEISEVRLFNDEVPMTYSYFHRVVKGENKR